MNTTISSQETGAPILVLVDDAKILASVRRVAAAVDRRLDEAELAELKNVQVAPGMPAQVMITTGEQTFANYILGPIFAGMNSALRESD